MSDLTRIRTAIDSGDPQAAEQLLPLVYEELRTLAARRLAHEAPGQTLQPTALVHEAYLRLVGDGADRHWDGRRHFFAADAEAMRRILVEHARRKHRAKRGGHWRRHDLDPDQLHASGAPAETKTRPERNRGPVWAGTSHYLVQAAATLGISPRTADRWWAYARARLLGELQGGDD
jgi:RNA polymerase sigma factor (TIGR02999 family)